jgi:hypothetical protein
MGNLMTNGTLDPFFRLYGPDGALLSLVGGYGYLAESIVLRATNSGTFLAVLTGNNAKFVPTGATGKYRITLAKTGTPVVTSQGDQGGAMTNGFMHKGFIDLGDADVYTVFANPGESIVVRMGDVPARGLDPYIYLYGPDGRLLQFVGGYGYIAEEVLTRATNSGLFTVVLAGANGLAGGTGPVPFEHGKHQRPLSSSPLTTRVAHSLAERCNKAVSPSAIWTCGRS